MANIWFSSDLHFEHKNIIRLCGRPFSDIHQMNEVIVANFNAVIQPRDTLYILGDVDFKGRADDLVKRINGTKVLIRGNHDRNWEEGIFDEVCDIKEVIANFDGQSYRFVCCHYPFAEWNGFYRGYYHLHGHQHNKPDYNVEQRESGLLRYDVGVDANGFYPVSAKQIVEFFNETKR